MSDRRPADPEDAASAPGSWQGPAGHMLRLVGVVLAVAGLLGSLVVGAVAAGGGLTVATLELIPGGEPHPWLDPTTVRHWALLAGAGVLAVAVGSVLARGEPGPLAE